MPTTKQALPRTIQRSPAKAQRTYAKAHDKAVREYGVGRARTQDRAFRTETLLREGRRSLGTEEGEGPFRPASSFHSRNGRTRGWSYGGVDVFGHSKRELYERARKLGGEGRSSMSKKELASAIARKQR